jgi:hypothetical protein
MRNPTMPIQLLAFASEAYGTSEKYPFPCVIVESEWNSIVEPRKPGTLPRSKPR